MLPHVNLGDTSFLEGIGLSGWFTEEIGQVSTRTGPSTVALMSFRKPRSTAVVRAVPEGAALAACGVLRDAGGRDVRSLLRERGRLKGQPTAVVINSRTLQSTFESGARADYDGAKRRKRSKVHIAVERLGHLLALKVTAASAGDRDQVGALAEEVQQVTGQNVELAYVDQGCTHANVAEAAQQHCLWLEVVKHIESKRGFLLLP